MDKLATLWAFVCRRKYLITLVVFVVIVGFLDENSIVRRMEKYLMKKPNEDIYVFEEDIEK